MLIMASYLQIYWYNSEVQGQHITECGRKLKEQYTYTGPTVLSIKTWKQ